MTKHTATPLPWKHAHFVGIGGVGMSGMALIMAELGVKVSGSDPAESMALERLRVRGIPVASEHRPDNVAEADVVVYSSAIAEDNPELAEASRRGITTVRRGRFLAELARHFETVIAVGGSHGKTTTTAMIAHVLRENGHKPGFLVGGEVVGWEAPASAGNGRILVTEVDESDGTQALMASALAVIVNVDDDHCWNVGGVEQLQASFRRFADSATELVTWDSPETRRLFGDHPGAAFCGPPQQPPGLDLALPGEYHRVNATLAMVAACRFGVAPAAAVAALNGFRGPRRRMTTHYTAPDASVVLVEDYAHHPTELAAALGALRETYPGHRLTVVFQPHRFERVRRYGADFSRILSRSDEVVVVPPFAAWVGDSGSSNPRQIAEAIAGPPAQYWEKELEELATHLAAVATAGGEPACIAIIGAGDVCAMVRPLRALLTDAFLSGVAAGLARRCPGLRVGQGRSWGQLTTLGIGHARPLLAEPTSGAELADVLAAGRERGLAVSVMGNGSNLVGTDAEQPVLFVRLAQGEFANWQDRGETVHCGAGVNLRMLWHELIAADRLPAAAAALGWVPATLGGAVHMNAGADGITIGQFVRKVVGIRRSGEAWEADGNAVGWGYRTTSIPPDVIVTSVDLELPREHTHSARRRYNRAGRQRAATQPSGRHAGCVFRNPGASSAGRLLDISGCKGLRVGHCHVSRRHANFIVTARGATEAQFVELLLTAQRRVYNVTGVRLQPEVVFADPATGARVAAALPALEIAVLKGGPSAERAVSLVSGAAVAEALRQAGHRVTEIDFSEPKLPSIPVGTDVVFPVLHGTFGEDGALQQLLEEAGWPYVGTGPAASHALMAKHLTKERLVAAGIPTPGYVLVDSADAPFPEHLGLPLIVKPNAQGSSVGMTRLNSRRAWKRALRRALKFGDEVLVEAFIAGVETTVGILHGTALPVIEIIPPRGRMFDYDAKYEHKRGHTKYLCPPQHVSQARQTTARRVAEEVAHLLGAKDMVRIDFIIDSNGTPFVLEGNSIPGFTATSLLPQAASALGIAFPELCARLVRDNVQKGWIRCAKCS